VPLKIRHRHIRLCRELGDGLGAGCFQLRDYGI